MADISAKRAAAFWARVEIEGSCKVWRGRRNWSGYGQTALSGRKISAHRLAWVLTHGEAPPGLHVLHSCDNRACCNPEHLHLGTHTDNMREMAARGRRAVRPAPVRVTPADVQRMAQMKADGVGCCRIARLFGMGRVRTARLLRGELQEGLEVGACPT